MDVFITLEVLYTLPKYWGGVVGYPVYVRLRNEYCCIYFPNVCVYAFVFFRNICFSYGKRKFLPYDKRLNKRKNMWVYNSLCMCVFVLCNGMCLYLSMREENKQPYIVVDVYLLCYCSFLWALFLVLYNGMGLIAACIIADFIEHSKEWKGVKEWEWTCVCVCGYTLFWTSLKEWRRNKKEASIHL